MVMNTKYLVYFTFISGSWWMWFCKNIWCFWTLHLSIDIYPMVFVNSLQLLYTNGIYGKSSVIHHAKIVLNTKLVWIVNIHTICLLLYYVCFAVGEQKVQYISSSQNKTLINRSCQTWPTLNQVLLCWEARKLQIYVHGSHRICSCTHWW